MSRSACFYPTVFKLLIKLIFKMEKTGSKQFKVNTKGTCFICFKKLKPAVIIRTVDFSSSSDDEEVIRETKREKWITSSLKTLCTYLKVNMEKVFSSDSAMPSHLLEELRKAEVKATLCLECRKYVDKMENLLMELDKVKLQLGNCLKNIHDKLMEAEDDGVKQKYWDETLGNSRALMHVAVVEKLRKEVLEKCFCVVSNVNPKVKLERLNPACHAKSDPERPEVKAVDEQIVTLSSDSESDNPSSSDDDKPLALRVGRRVLHSSSSSASSIPSSSDSSDDESSTVNSRRSSFSVDTNPDPLSTGDVSLNSNQKTPKDDPVKRLYPFKCKVCRRRFRSEEKFNTHDHDEPPKIQLISDLVLEEVAKATQKFNSSQQQMHINKKKNPEKEKKSALSQKSPVKRLQKVKTALKTLKNQKKALPNIRKKNTPKVPKYFSLRDLVQEGKEGRRKGNPPESARQRFACSLCPNQYTRLHDLNRHFQKNHTVQINSPYFNGAQQPEQLHQVQTNSELLNIPEDNFEIERILPDDGEDDDMKIVTVTEEIDLHITPETEQFIQEVIHLPSKMQPLVYNSSDLGCSSSTISIQNESKSIGWTPIGHRFQFVAEGDEDDDNETQCTLPFEEISNDDVKMDTDLEKALEPIIILDTDDDADDATKIDEKTLPCLPMQV